MPVYTVPEGEARVMAGIPTARLQLDSLVIDPIIFIGMGVERDGEVVTLHDQITAIRYTTISPWADTAGAVNTHDSATTPYFYGSSSHADPLCARARATGCPLSSPHHAACPCRHRSLRHGLVPITH